KPDRTEYEPRQQGTVLVSTRDVDGRPVRAEVALAVTDDAVSAIQSDLAPDPRQFFFGQTRWNVVNTAASVQAQRYVNLVEEKGKLIDDRVLKDLKRRDGTFAFDSNEEVGGVIGGRNAPVAAPPPPMLRKDVAESITVTAQAPALDVRPMTITVRSDFRSTAFWQPDVITGADGTARVTLKYPEALTTWRASARAVTTATQVGMGTATAVTKMPLIVRLEAPRFFVAGDRVTISAVINNNTDVAMMVTPSIDAEGVRLETAATLAAVDVPAHGESRADWRIIAEHAGPAKLRVTGRGPDRGDAMEKSFIVYEHGVDKLIAKSGKVRGDDAAIHLALPHDRRATALTVRVQPSIAAVMLDALPYLVDYPYGCTEQTMSRFLPAAVVARTLRKNGRGAGALEGKLHDVEVMSMQRLHDFQHDDGGWGWWKEDTSDAFMTAYVVWGFALAKEAAMVVDDQSVRNGVGYLDHELVQDENAWERQAWMLHAIGAWRAATHDTNVTAEERKAIENVWKHRERLSSYSRALFTLAAHDFGDTAKTAVLVRNLKDGVKIDRGADPDAAETMATARWGADGFWWRWYEGPVESTAFALQALVRVDPQNKLIEPAMNWLVKNRRGAQWNNTRD
ncbi:MAG TPA: alpha-2-macroglobulin family protein, partial [Thermoanaerobaculia bacterium]|nr:alpha-2-macroglobulin family protein [Thermoanaerobaculia bacterium]